MINTIIHWYVCQFMDQYGPMYYGISFVMFSLLIAIDQILVRTNNNLQTYHTYIQLFGSRGMAAATTNVTTKNYNTTSASSTNAKIWKSLLMVPKSWFRYFYIIATINVCIVSYYIFFVLIQRQQQQQQEVARIKQPTTVVRITIGYLIIVVLYSIHVCRRVYENYFVHYHPLDSSSNISQMHLLIFIGGLLYYTFLPCVLLLYVPYMNENNSFCCTCTTTVTTSSNDTATILTTPFPEATSNNNKVTTISTVVSLFIVGSFNIICQYEQYYHHVLLASLRTSKSSSSSSSEQTIRRMKKDDDDNNKTHNQQQQPIYRIPYGGFFKYVSCPHYMFEILIYITFGILLYIDNRLVIINGKQVQQQLLVLLQRNDNNTTSSTTILKLLFNVCSLYRYWMLLGFIIINLCYSANDIHIAYNTRFTTTYTTLNRKRIFPGIF